MNSFPDCCITEEQAWLLNQTFGEHDDTYGSIELPNGGFVRPGELVALLGPSGAGKTTLLNVLTGRNCRSLIVDGLVTVNGQSIGRRIGAISAYVQQENFFVSSITVREHLLFQALLRLPHDMPREKKLARVEEVISEFGLMKCANLIIRPPGLNQGISGGEAKRVAFASQMLTNPSVIFCDEPTTGLDSFMAENVVSFLQGLANRGKTVLCTIHQPPSAVFSMFHKLSSARLLVFILAEGRLAFFGTINEALTFFASLDLPCPLSYNPSDFFIHSLAIDPSNKEESKLRMLVSSLFRSETRGLFVRSLYGTAIAIIERFEESKYGAMVQHVVDKEGKAAAQVFFALFVGLLYFQTPLNQSGIMNRNGVLFFFISHFSFPVLPREYPTFYREHQDYTYTVSSYYASKIIFFVRIFMSIVIYSIDGLLFLLIAYFMIGLLLSASCPTLPVALAVVGPILTLFQLTGGLFANISTIPSYFAWIQYLSWFRHGYEAYLITNWHNVNNISEK
ncbi:ABC membrane transporter [Trichuris trichiura]|uniref:ABC membrane transporter n=1 Tax=Trichuris trichiura TaxID=36087 RepID=A0A077ZEH5_TRITR|nr:ABC membrane transporter [Trichuris trichiura]